MKVVTLYGASRRLGCLVRINGRKALAYFQGDKLLGHIYLSELEEIEDLPDVYFDGQNYS